MVLSIAIACVFWGFFLKKKRVDLLPGPLHNIERNRLLSFEAQTVVK